MKRYIKARKVCQSLKNGAGVYQSCKAAQLSVTSFWNWRQEKPKFDKFVNKLFAGRTQLVIDALYKNALEGKIAAQIFWLKNNAGWQDSPLIDQSHHSHFTVAVTKANGHENRVQATRKAD